MFSRKIDGFVVKTYHPGFKEVNPRGDAEYDDMCKLSPTELAKRYPDKPGFNRNAIYFHTTDMLMRDGKVKEECIGVINVPETLEDGSRNEEGIQIFEREEDAVRCVNLLIKKD